MTTAPEVLVAMSGGVDSSVAAAMLLDAGHRVVGVTMKLWGGDSDSGCCSVSDVDDARRVAHQLGIDHHVFNFGDDFDAHVVTPYVQAHAAGRTPNPCIECNRHLKFDRLLRRASMLGIELVATGHHARIVTSVDGIHHVARGADRAKDQSYVLHMLGQAQLARLRFPLGDTTKAHVREVAAARGLRTATKPDSQDVCFITTTTGRTGFLADRLALTPGRVVDERGAVVGAVPAVELVTIGQRKGLGTAGGHDPQYAVDVDLPSATVTIGSRRDLERRTVALDTLEWAHVPHEGPVQAQVSAHGAARPAVFDASTATLTWQDPQRRVAPGQSVVLYDAARGELVLGGGTAR
jgi:tRNA-uridine 2-sulfurtransferase